MGELVRVSGLPDLEGLGYAKDDRGVYIIDEE